MSATTRTDHTLERLVFFSDAVFAIAITLLVLEIKVPVLPRGAPDHAVWNALAELIPSFVGYVISFAVIGMFWIGHHRAFAMAGRYSGKVLGWNMAMLCVIVFMPFVTAFDALNLNQHVPGMVYCGTLLVAGLLNAAVVRVATGPDMAADGMDPLKMAYARRRSYSVVLGAAAAFAIAMVAPRWGQFGLISIGLWRRLLTQGTVRS